MKIIHRGTVYPMSIEGRNCHASHCLPLPDGSVLAVWFEGTREGATDVCIFSARCSPEGVWSAPRRITEDNGIPHWNPVLFRRRTATCCCITRKAQLFPNGGRC